MRQAQDHGVTMRAAKHRAHRSAIDADCADRGNGTSAVASDFRRGHFGREQFAQQTAFGIAIERHGAIFPIIHS